MCATCEAKADAAAKREEARRQKSVSAMTAPRPSAPPPGTNAVVTPASKRPSSIGAPTKAAAAKAGSSAPGPWPDAPADMIPKGSVIAPPKKNGFAADKEAEEKWFGRLEQTSVEELEPGDILIRKIFDHASMVVRAQSAFQADKGSKFSSHTMLAVGNGQIAHAYEVPMTVAVSAPLDADVIVWRPVDPTWATSAVEVARWLISLGMTYSVEDCLNLPFHSSDWGPEGQRRADKVARRRKPSDRSMCSEFITYCYQGMPNHPNILLDAKRTPPMRLEDYLNEHPDHFRFAGTLHRSTMVGTEPGGVMSHAVRVYGQELKDDFKKAGRRLAKIF